MVLEIGVGEQARERVERETTRQGSPRSGSLPCGGRPLGRSRGVLEILQSGSVASRAPRPDAPPGGGPPACPAPATSSFRKGETRTNVRDRGLCQPPEKRAVVPAICRALPRLPMAALLRFAYTRGDGCGARRAATLDPLETSGRGAGAGGRRRDTARVGRIAPGGPEYHRARPRPARLAVA